MIEIIHNKINVRSAKDFVADNLIVIGDASCSRYYKNGIESALITSSQAVKAFFEPRDSNSLRQNYLQPVRKIIARDNRYGRYIFKLFDLVFLFRYTADSLQKMLQDVKLSQPASEMKEIMWYTYTGCESYRTIFKLLRKLLFNISFFQHLLRSMMNPLRRRD